MKNLLDNESIPRLTALAWYPDEREDGYPDVELFDFFHIDTLPSNEAWTYIDCNSVGERGRACEGLLMKLHEQTPTQAQHIEKILSDNLAIRRLQLAAIVRWFENDKAVPEIETTGGVHHETGWRWEATWDSGSGSYWVRWYAQGYGDGMPTRFDRVLSLESMQPPREVFHAHRTSDILVVRRTRLR